MKSLDFLIKLYENTGEKIVISDKNLISLWKSHDFLPDIIPKTVIQRAKYSHNNDSNKENAVFKFTDKFTVKMFPITENEEIVGYVLNFFNSEDIETLYCNSVLAKYRKKMFASERIALMPIINDAANYYYEDKDIPKEYFIDSQKNVAKLLSTNVNRSQISRYYSHEIYPTITSISQSLENISKRFQNEIDCDNLDFSLDIAPALFGEIDSSCLETAILNLMVNGFMYNNSAKKKLTLKAYKKDRKIIIDVWDNGNDADLNKMEQASYPFNGLDLSSEGECLGLALARNFAEYFGGTLTILKDDQGLTVRTSLPDKKTEPISFNSRRRIIPAGIYFDSLTCIIAKSQL